MSDLRYPMGGTKVDKTYRWSQLKSRSITRETREGQLPVFQKWSSTIRLYFRKTSINVRTMVSNAIEALYIFDSNQFVATIIERQGLY